MTNRILIVDSEAVVRNLATELLVRRSFEVDQAANEREAITLLRDNEYALVMLDLTLRDSSGFRLLEHLQQQFPTLKEHTIVMTRSEPKFLASLPQEGWCAILLKPFSASELYRIVELCLGGTESTGAAIQ